MEKILLYFGCNERVGHGLYGRGGQSVSLWSPGIPGMNPNLIRAIDNTFTPHGGKQSEYLEVDVYPVKILAWNDYTIDSRPGSNSNLIGYGYSSAEDMIEDAYKLFPKIMNRQPKITPFLTLK